MIRNTAAAAMKTTGEAQVTVKVKKWPDFIPAMVVGIMLN